MKRCPAPCNHERLLHDTWGCKVCRTACGISIVYLTDLFAVAVDRSEDQKSIELAKLIDQEDDRRNERGLTVLRQRVAEDSESATTE